MEIKIEYYDFRGKTHTMGGRPMFGWLVRIVVGTQTVYRAGLFDTMSEAILHCAEYLTTNHDKF